jgi:hypothetical protein
MKIKFKTFHDIKPYEANPRKKDAAVGSGVASLCRFCLFVFWHMYVFSVAAGGIAPRV